MWCCGVEVHTALGKCGCVCVCLIDSLISFMLLFLTEYQGDYYGPGSNYDFFPHGPPSSQAQSPAESPYILGSGPGAMEGSGHHPSDDQRFTDMISHPETPSPEPGLPSSLQPVPGEAYSGGPSPPFSMASNSSYSAPMSHQGQEMGESTAW